MTLNYKGKEDGKQLLLRRMFYSVSICIAKLDEYSSVKYAHWNNGERNKIQRFIKMWANFFLIQSEAVTKLKEF